MSNRKIHLKIRRAQKSGMLGGKPIFMLDVIIELSKEDHALIAKYRFGDMVVYDSQARRARNQQAAAHGEDAYVQSHGSTGRSAWSALKAVGSAAMAALTLRVTVNSLIKGQHIECKELDEMLAAQAAIIEACETLKSYLDTALTFDGRETLLEI